MSKTPPPPRPPARPPARPAAPPADVDPDRPPQTDEPPPRMPARHEDPAPRDPEDAAPAARARAPLRVRATRDGYYGEKYRRTGDVFTLERGDPLGRWMEEVDPDTPEHTTSHGQALQEQRVDVMTQRAIERGSAGGVHTAIDNPDDGLDPIGARES
jgi:hypothetical protein